MPQATVIVTSRNRRETCAKTIESSLAQTGIDQEILVIDDCSDDDTAGFIRQRFPAVRVHRKEKRGGLIVARNHATRLAASPVVVSIDDDAVFISNDTLAAAVSMFDHPRVGAVAIPFVNHVNGADEKCIVPDAPSAQSVWLTNTFVGTAYAVRRDMFVALGGFDERLVHWAEEQEYCQRLMGAGYVIRIGTSGLIRHFPAGVGKYNLQSIRRLTRNNIWSASLNSPMPLTLPLVLGQAVRATLGGFKKPKELRATIEGVPWGIASVIRHWFSRRPMSREAFSLWMDIRRRKPVKLDDIETRLPPMLKV